jgi:hypothetical protein
MGNSGSAPISGPNGQPQGQQGQQTSPVQNATAKVKGLFSSITGSQPQPQPQPQQPPAYGGGKRRRNRKKVKFVTTTTLKKRTKKGSKTRKSAA